VNADAFELVSLRGGAIGIRSREYDEICHPGIGPRAEADALYVRGLDLVRRLERTRATGEPFVIWDVGLGGAANASAVLQAAGAVPCAVRMISFDRQLDQLAFAARHAAELDYFGALAPAAARLVDEPEIRFEHGRASVVWTRVVGDFPTLLAEAAPGTWPAPHAILFDPHSPAANPEMWTLPLFRLLWERLDAERPCGLATYSRSTAVRTALLLTGFWVGGGGSTATKEDTTVAANRPELLAQPLGGRWLERARRSRAAEPWTTPPYGGRPLTDATWEALRSHPQFAGITQPTAI
jgi:queuine tRNA-ribosyltransferase